MTGIVHHKTRRFALRHRHHTYLVDVGNAISLPLMEVSELNGKNLLAPPYPETRYFEIEIEEKRAGGTRTALFQNIYPVRAERKPDLSFLKFRIRRGRWSVTERIHFPTETGEALWVYTDDFNILFLSSGGRHDLDMLVAAVTRRLCEIAEAEIAGNRIPSEFENQLACRAAINDLFSEGVDGAFPGAGPGRESGLTVPGDPGRDRGELSGAEISTRHGRADLGAEKEADLRVDLSGIDELNDLSWLQ